MRLGVSSDTLEASTCVGNCSAESVGRGPGMQVSRSRCILHMNYYRFLAQNAVAVPFLSYIGLGFRLFLPLHCEYRWFVLEMCCCQIELCWPYAPSLLQALPAIQLLSFSLNALLHSQFFIAFPVLNTSCTVTLIDVRCKSAHSVPVQLALGCNTEAVIHSVRRHISDAT